MSLFNRLVFSCFLPLCFSRTRGVQGGGSGRVKIFRRIQFFVGGGVNVSLNAMLQ